MAARINPPRVELPADTLGQDAENRRRRVALLLTTRAGEQGGARDFGLGLERSGRANRSGESHPAS